jgi:hypothetical protein
MCLIRFAILSVIIFSLSACNPRMQLITLESTNLKITNHEIQYHDNLVFIDYNFYSLNGLMQLTIFNKSTIPVYIDWDKSYLRNANGDVTRFFYYIQRPELRGNDIVHKGKLIYYDNINLIEHWEESYIVNSNYPENMTPLTKDSITILFPGQNIRVSPFHLEGNRINMLNYKKAKIEEKPNWEETIKTTHVAVYSFDINNTPSVYTNSLLISATSDFRDAFVYEDKFWIKEIRRMDPRQVIGVENYYHYLNNTQVSLPIHPYRSANRFYIR